MTGRPALFSIAILAITLASPAAAHIPERCGPLVGVYNDATVAEMEQSKRVTDLLMERARFGDVGYATGILFRAAERRTAALRSLFDCINGH